MGKIPSENASFTIDNTACNIYDFIIQSGLTFSTKGIM